MSRISITLVTFFGLCLSSWPALAQTGISQSGEIPTSDAAIKLLQPIDGTTGLAGDLSKNGVDNTQSPVVATETTAVEPEPITLVTYPVKGLRLLNCSGGTVKVKTYNSNDAVTLIAYEEKAISNGDYRTLGCATRACKISVGGGKARSPMFGLHAFLGGSSYKEITARAFSLGCSAVK